MPAICRKGGEFRLRVEAQKKHDTWRDSMASVFLS
jgi:hypothetical protein